MSNTIEQPPSGPIPRASGLTRAQQMLLQLAALVIIIAGLKLASEIVVPFLLAAFIAIVVGAPIGWLVRHRLPMWLAIVLVLSVLMVVFAALGALIGQSVTQFLGQITFYQQRFMEITHNLLGFLSRFGMHIDMSAVANYLDPSQIIQMVGVALRGFGGVLSNSLLILLTVVFMLLEAWSFPKKLRRTLRDPHDSLPHFERFTATVNRYMAIKTTVSVAMGVVVALILSLIGVDFPLLWGLLTFLLNYVSNIGSEQP